MFNIILALNILSLNIGIITLTMLCVCMCVISIRTCTLSSAISLFQVAHFIVHGIFKLIKKGFIGAHIHT